MGGRSAGEEERVRILIMDYIAKQWQTAFLQTIQSHENAAPLREAAINEQLGNWTKELTSVIVASCEAMNLQATAIGYNLQLLPISQFEYLSLDVMAFSDGGKRWHFPSAVFELENSRNNDRIAYSLWKVLCVHADLRVVFCYRRNADEGSDLVRFLRDEVVHAMNIESRSKLEGQTIIVVGSRNDSDTFPYGFFKWWILDLNTGTFQLY